jgi:hypothetical protein
MEKKEPNMGVSDENGGKKDVFRVPDEYFDHLPGRVMERIRGEGAQGRGGVVPLRQKISRSLVAAAAALLLVIAGHYLLRTESVVPEGETDSAVTAYVMSGDVDEQTLYEFIEGEDILPEAYAAAGGEDPLIDYLVSEGVDESLLAELY